MGLYTKIVYLYRLRVKMDFRGKIARYRGISDYRLYFRGLGVVWGLGVFSRSRCGLLVCGCGSSLGVGLGCNKHTKHSLSKHTKREDAHFQSALSAINI